MITAIKRHNCSMDIVTPSESQKTHVQSHNVRRACTLGRQQTYCSMRNTKVHGPVYPTNRSTASRRGNQFIEQTSWTIVSAVEYAIACHSPSQQGKLYATSKQGKGTSGGICLRSISAISVAPKTGVARLFTVLVPSVTRHPVNKADATRCMALGETSCKP